MGIFSKYKARRAAKKAAKSVTPSSGGGSSNLPMSTLATPTSAAGSSIGVSSGGGGSSVSSGGGGSSGGSSNLPMSTLATPTSAATTPTQTQIAKDIPSSYQGVVQPATSTTGIKEGYSYFKDNIRRDIGQAFVGAAQIATGGIRNKVRDVRESIQERKDRIFRENVERSKGKFGVSEEDKLAAMKGYSGTSSSFKYKETPDAVLIRDANLGDQAALVAYTERVNEKNEIEFRVQETKQLNLDKTKLKNYTSQIQGQISSGLITYEQGVEEQKRYADNLDKDRIISVENKLAPKIKSQQEKIDKISKKGRISRVVLTTAGAFVVGAVTAPLIVSAPKIIQTGAGIVGGGILAVSTLKTTKGLVTGKAGLLEAAELALPVAGFIAGGAIGMKIAGASGVKVDSKLNTALETAEVKVLSTKALTTETQIKALRLSPSKEAELIMQLNAGESIGVRTWKLKAKTRNLQKVIDTQLPNTEIVSFGQTRTLGNIYSANTILKVKVGGKVNYVDLTTGETVGIYNPATKTVTAETFTARAELGKPIIEITRSAQVIKPKVKYYMENGQLKRIVGSESYSFEGIKIKAPEGKQITYKDLIEVVKSDKYKTTPSSKFKALEIQKAIGVKGKVAILDAGETSFGFTGKQLKFITENSAGVGKNIPKPVEYTKDFSRKMKPFDSAKDLNLKGLEKPSANTKQMLETLNKQSIDLGVVPQLELPEFKTNVVESLKRGAKKQIQIPKQESAVFGVDSGQVKLDSKQLNSLLQTSFLDMDKLQEKLKDKTKNRNKTRTGTTGVVAPKPFQIPKQVPIQYQSPVQISKQTQKSKIPRAMQIPTPSPLLRFPIPTSPKLDIQGFGFGFPSLKKQDNYKKLMKQLSRKRKPIAKYTASLGAAAFQVKPLKVSRKEFERLSKRTYSGAETRPVLEIVDDDTKKIATQLKAAVNF